VRACVFDAYGTLFDVHSAAAREAGALGEQKASVSALWRQKQLEYSWLRSLMGRHADFWQVTGDALDFALESHGIEDRALRERLMALYLELAAYPDVVPALERLRDAGLATAILSNGTPTMLEAAVRSAGIERLLDQVLSIEAVGVYKPDPRVYRLAVEGLGVPAEAIAFVSTNAWDAAGAAAFGFRVAWMNRFGARMERLGTAPAAVIGSLEELPPLLAAG